MLATGSPGDGEPLGSGGEGLSGAAPAAISAVPKSVEESFAIGPAAAAVPAAAAPPMLSPPAAELPAAPGRGNDEESAYSREFWFAYAANAAVMIAVSILFRYGDFVQFYGGSEFQLGLIVGVGNVGALLMRFVLGVQVDRFGPRAVWLLSLAGVAVSLLLHLAINQIDTPLVFAARVLLSASLAGVFAASITYISLLAPRPRMGEMIGVLGSSGFIGQAIGPLLGDWIFGQKGGSEAGIDALFAVAAALTCLSLVLVYIGTHQIPRDASEHDEPAWWELLRRHHPGFLLAMGVAAAVGLGIPTTFLAPFVAAHGVSGIAPFFLVYAATAFSVRVFARTLTDEWGTYRVVLLGTTLLAAGAVLLLVLDLPGVDQWEAGRAWLLAIPAVVTGVAHAFLFPAIVAGGGAAFPDRYRGLGMTLILSTFDFGNLVGPPLVGSLLTVSVWLGWPAYGVTFSLMGVLLVGLAALYAATASENDRITAAERM